MVIYPNHLHQPPHGPRHEHVSSDQGKTFLQAEVRPENEEGRGGTAHGVCQLEWISDLRRSVDLHCEVNHGGEDGNSIGTLTCWVEGGGVNDLEEKDLCPRIPPHCRCTG